MLVLRIDDTASYTGCSIATYFVHTKYTFSRERLRASSTGEYFYETLARDTKGEQYCKIKLRLALRDQSTIDQTPLRIHEIFYSVEATCISL